MKIWLKYLVALILGAGLAFAAPIDGPILSFIAKLLTNVSRYALVPLIVFSLIVAVQKLREDRKLLRLGARTTLYALLSIAGFSILGILGAFALSPARIPLNADAQSFQTVIPTGQELLARVFPVSMSAAALDGEYLMPLVILGIVLGLGLAFDRSVTKPLNAIADAASRTMWQINGFIVELFPVALIVLSAATVSGIKGILRLNLYANLLTVLLIEALIVALVVLPLVLLAHNHKANPYKTLYALLGPSLVGLVGGHALVPTGVLAKHLKDSLGIKRRAGALSLPLALSFGRAGSALVSATSFIVVLSSYSGLGLGSGTVAWMMLFVPLSSLLLSAAPGSGPLTALVFLSAAYGRGFESGYLLMVPVALPLMAIASFLDALCAGCVARLAAGAEGYAEEKAVRHFI